MSLEAKLAGGIKKHADREARRKNKSEPKSESKSDIHRVEIEKLDKGHTVTAYKKHTTNGEYQEPQKTAHKSIHEAFRHAKGLMGVNADEGQGSSELE